MLLCIDIGNTNIKLGLFDDETMRTRWRIATDRDRLADEYAMLLLNLLSSENLRIEQVTGCAISSVVPGLTQVFSELSQRYLKQEPLIYGQGMRVDIRITTDNPAEVGADLVMNALAARRMYGTPVIIVGFGTATSFVAVSDAGDLEGVAIAPGLATGGESLFRSTATLPQIALARPTVAIGKNTVASLQAGLIYGYAGLVDGVARRMRAELGGSARVIATGGLASLVAPETELIEAVEPDLALVGLRLMFELNQQ